MKILKKILIISSLLLFTFSATILGKSIDFPAVTSYKYVNDYTNTLSQSSINKIVNIGEELEEKTTAQCIIVIVNSTDNLTIEEYSNELFRNWGIGTSEKNNGLLILLAINDKKWRVEVGKGLEGVIPDALSNKIMISYGKPYFIEGNYDEGLLNAYFQFSNIIAKEYEISLNSSENLNISSNENNSSYNKTNFLIIGLILLFLGDSIFNRGRLLKTLLTIILFNNHNYPKGPRGGSGGFNTFNNRNNRGGFGGGSSNGGGSSGSW